MPAIEEKILLYKVKIKHDPDAFGILYDRYVGPIYRYVYFKVSQREEAEDITSDVFLKAWQYLIDGMDRDVQNFRPFVYTIARNCVIDLYRARMKRSVLPLTEAEAVPDPRNLHEAVAAVGDVAELLRTMKKMKHEYQEVILLRHVEGLSLGEIAVIMGRSSVATRVTLHRAMRKLKELSSL